MRVNQRVVIRVICVDFRRRIRRREPENRRVEAVLLTDRRRNERIFRGSLRVERRLNRRNERRVITADRRVYKVAARRRQRGEVRAIFARKRVRVSKESAVHLYKTNLELASGVQHYPNLNGWTLCSPAFRFYMRPVLHCIIS